MGYSDDKKNSFPDTPLEREIFQKIKSAENRSIPFAEFMETALYHRDHGYYSKPWEREIGRKGDFFTSVSVGETFGYLIARAIEREWRENFDSVENFTIIEQGAHDGQLALDIANALADFCPDFFKKGGNYQIFEPREEIRNWLESRLHEATGSVRRTNPVASEMNDDPTGCVRQTNPVVSCPTVPGTENGIFIANELLDAFPVHRIQFGDGEWRELQVTEWEGGFAWQPVQIESCSPLGAEISTLGCEDFPDGYTTEICLAIHPWLDEMKSIFSAKGQFWIFDYGFESADYFAPHRTTGTLQCYREHRKSENPFEAIGETDLTTHVNFSHLKAAAEKCGFSQFNLTDQHHFLIRAAEGWFREIDGEEPDSMTAKRIRQFQTLTHPGLMGQSFKVAAFQRGTSVE